MHREGAKRITSRLCLQREIRKRVQDLDMFRTLADGGLQYYEAEFMGYATTDFFCESPFICKLYRYIQQMV
jgi:hypothetical protein